LVTTVTKQIYVHSEIKSVLNSGNACYHSVQNLLRSPLLSKIVMIKVYKTIILPVLMYGCQTWSLTLREEHVLSMFGNRMLRRILGPKREEVTGEWRRMRNEELHDLYASRYSDGQTKEVVMCGACSTHGKDEKCIQYFRW